MPNMIDDFMNDLGVESGEEGGKADASDGGNSQQPVMQKPAAPQPVMKKTCKCEGQCEGQCEGTDETESIRDEEASESREPGC